MLNPAVEARYVQINPIEWNEQSQPDKHDICMRAALYKCRGKAQRSKDGKKFLGSWKRCLVKFKNNWVRKVRGETGVLRKTFLLL